MDTILYRVRPGDSLTKIIKRYYGSASAAERDSIIKQIQADNNTIKNPNKIYPNQLLQISIPQQYCTATSHPAATPVLRIDKKLIKPLQSKWQPAGKKVSGQPDTHYARHWFCQNDHA